MGFSTNSLQVESVTPEKAAEFLKANYASNRKLRPSWVSYLVREMSEGRFMSTAEVHIMYRNGEPTMVNGQHTCSAIVAYGKPVRVTVRKTHTNEPGQIAMAYAFGHDNGVRRTFTDGMNAYKLSEQTGLFPQQINKMVGALRYIKTGFRRGSITGGGSMKVSPADMVEYVIGLAPLVHKFDLAISPCEKPTRQKLYSVTSMSIALVTFYYKPIQAVNFWQQIAIPDKLAWSDSRVTARRYIDSSRLKGHVAEAELARKIARCWKAYLLEQPLQMAKVDHASIMAIEGTPFTGRQAVDFFPFTVDSALIQANSGTY